MRANTGKCELVKFDFNNGITAITPKEHFKGKCKL
jgi:hypothetical protein